jgi:hypothetical protein
MGSLLIGGKGVEHWVAEGNQAVPLFGTPVAALYHLEQAVRVAVKEGLLAAEADATILIRTQNINRCSVTRRNLLTIRF